MPVSKAHFTREILKEIQNNNVSIFAGAGLSRSSGYVNWKELLRTVASDLNLDIDQESDLVTIAQYYKNRHGRQGINQAILDEFTREAEENENLRILSRLPIDTYWTTNYDKLIEENLEKNGKKVDVKINQNNLKNYVQNRDVIVYKMHGDVSDPDSAVIVRDDYERYNEKRSLFTVNLQGELVSKTFLFIGFSFEDPNLERILSRIRVTLDSRNGRNHYCFLRKINCSDYNKPDDYNYAEIKQQLRIQDLKRYGIRTVLVDNYNEITMILNEIEMKHKLSRIFISGSAYEYGIFGEEKAVKLLHNLPKKLIKHEYKILSGFGLGVGSYVINGALDEIYSSKYKHVSEYLTLRPFPQFASGDMDLMQLWDKYRKDLISEAGVTLFVFGNKKADGQVVNANGVMREFQIAKEKNNCIIPVGSSGYAAKAIYEEIKDNIANYEYLVDSLEILENSIEPEEIINEIICILDRIRRG